MKIKSLWIVLVTTFAICSSAYAATTVTAYAFGPYDRAYTNAMENLYTKHPGVTYLRTTCRRHYRSYMCTSYGTIN